VITDAWKGVERFLDPGVEILVARDGDETIGHLVSLTAERARAIGQAAMRRALAEHTYDRRAEQLEALLCAKPMVFVEIA
jgi:spore maturation protein CgeB